MCRHRNLNGKTQRRENMNQVKIKGGRGNGKQVSSGKKMCTCSHASPSMRASRVSFYTSVFMWTPVHTHSILYVLSITMHMCTYSISAFVLGFISVCMHSCCISQLCWVFLLLCSSRCCVLSAWIHWFTHSSTYLPVHVFVRCECVCAWVYWPWPAAPVGAPWWPQGSCPAGSAAHTQSEPTSLLCPFLPAATHTPGIHTCTYTETHKRGHTNTHVHIRLCVHTNNETHMHTHGQREDGSVSGTGEPQLVTTATRSARLA